jgi:hypothetical protein
MGDHDLAAFQVMMRSALAYVPDGHYFEGYSVCYVAEQRWLLESTSEENLESSAHKSVVWTQTQSCFCKNKDTVRRLQLVWAFFVRYTVTGSRAACCPFLIGA